MASETDGRVMDLSSLNLPTVDDVNAKPRAVPKGPTRLQKIVEARPLTKVDDKAFKDAVWLRDKKRCRCCERKVLRIMGRTPERGEVHHLHGRTGDLRFEADSAVLVCLGCHEKLTGRVAEKWIHIASKTYTTRQGTFTDARAPIKFQRAA